MPLLLKASRIRQHLPLEVKEKIQAIHIFQQLDSTNTWLLKRIKTTINLPSENTIICLAEQQIAGRGRQGKHWYSPRNKNIYLSLSWKFQHLPTHLPLLSLMCGLSCLKALRFFKIFDPLNLGTFGIKWPNDLYWQSQGKNKKFGGILIERCSDLKTLIIGIGINANMLNDKAQIDQDWTSLQRISGQQICRHQLVAALLLALLNTLEKFPEMGSKQILSQWEKVDILQGKNVTVQQTRQKWTGIARGIDPQGHLLVQDVSTKIRQIASADVSIRLSD